jgi:hypothetical protein
MESSQAKNRREDIEGEHSAVKKSMNFERRQTEE